jgi:hypothetical protein
MCGTLDVMQSFKFCQALPSIVIRTVTVICTLINGFQLGAVMLDE